MINWSHDWRNWASCRIAGQAGHGGGAGGGEAGRARAPGNAGRGADDQQDQADPGCRRRLQRRRSAAALSLTAVMSAPGPGFGLLRSASAAGALVAALAATRLLPVRHPGVALHVIIALFGLCIITLGLWTSCTRARAALFLAGLS